MSVFNLLGRFRFAQNHREVVREDDLEVELLAGDFSGFNRNLVF